MESVSAMKKASVEIVERGPVRASLMVKGKVGDFGARTIVKVYTGVRRIEFLTALRPLDLKPSELCRIVLAEFELPFEGRWTHATPYGFVNRDAIGEVYNLADSHPSRYWCDSSDGRRGFALLNRGVQICRVCGRKMLLILLRYGDGTWFPEPHPAEVHYALAPHSGDWRTGMVYRLGREFNFPLRIFIATRRRGELPPSTSFVKVSGRNALITALYREGDKLVARVVEAEGRKWQGEVLTNLPHPRAQAFSLPPKGMGEVFF